MITARGRRGTGRGTMAAGCTLLLAAVFSIGGCRDHTSALDERSYQLGIIGAFAEVVRLGVKELALSEPMAPADMDALLDDAEAIARRNGVQLHRETDFLVTDLYPAEVAAGKHVLLIYRGDTLRGYLELKARKAELERAGGYDAAAREALARDFGRLLSYPEPTINRLLTENALR